MTRPGASLRVLARRSTGESGLCVFPRFVLAMSWTCFTWRFRGLEFSESFKVLFRRLLKGRACHVGTLDRFAGLGGKRLWHLADERQAIRVTCSLAIAL